MKYMSICTISFVSFFFFFWLFCSFMGLVFIMNDYSIFIEWEVVSMNSMNIVMTLLFNWMSLIH